MISCYITGVNRNVPCGHFNLMMKMLLYLLLTSSGILFSLNSELLTFGKRLAHVFSSAGGTPAIWTNVEGQFRADPDCPHSRAGPDRAGTQARGPASHSL